jgi:glycosyltransferase involved in cell wall biosynthesis
MKILYICGIIPEWPTALRPLPPLDSGAPHGNIFRLIEELAASAQGKGFQVKVLSAISPEQVPVIKEKWPYGEYWGDYIWIVIPQIIRRISSAFLNLMPLSSGLLRRTKKADSIQAWYYLRNIRKLFKQFKPDMVILDDAPQFIKGLLTFVPKDKLAFYCRGDMGFSREWLHKTKMVLVTNDNLGRWVLEINPHVQQYFIVRNSLSPEYENLPWRPDRFRRDEKRIIFVGRLEPKKGLEYLIRAFAPVVGKYPAARLVIVGSALKEERANGSLSDYEKDMRSLAENTLPQGTYRWLGWLNQTQLVKEYQKSYLAIYPSTYVEGFGMVVLEAMACGLPVIASNCPGYASLIAQGGGILVDNPMDIDGLAEALLKLLDDPVLAESLGFQGYRLAKDYTVKQAAKEFLAITEMVQ